MTDDTPVLHLHHPADNRFTPRFISDDKQTQSKKTSQLSEQSDIEMAIADESFGGETIYLLYTREHLFLIKRMIT